MKLQFILQKFLVIKLYISILYIPGVLSELEKIEDVNNDKQLIVQPDFKDDPRFFRMDNLISEDKFNRLDDFKITNLIITSDIEGNINAVNRKTGELIWSLVGGDPLVLIHSDSDSDEIPTTIATYSAKTIENGYGYNRYNNPNTIESSLSSSTSTSSSLSSSASSYVRIGSSNRKFKNTNPKKDITWIVEPYGDGTVYHFTGDDGLEKLPISIKQLVMNSPFSIDNQFVYTGSRVSGIVKVNARTGAIVESFGLENIGTCSVEDNLYSENFRDHCDDLLLNEYNHDIEDYSNCENSDYFYGSHDFDDHENEIGPFITLGKTIYDLTIHSKNNTSWNITYVQWGANNFHSNLIDENIESIDNTYIQPFHDSSLLALDIDNKSIKWVSNLPYVTVNIFDVFLNSFNDDEYIVLPHPLDHKSSFPVDKRDLTYIDRTKGGSWFALSEDHYPSLVKSAPLAKYITNERWRLPSIFTNSDLLCIAISGVHDNSLKDHSLKNMKNDPNNHLAVYQSATAMNLPARFNQIKYGSESKRLIDSSNTNKLSINDYDHDHDHDMIGIDYKTPTLTFKNTSFSHLIYRVLENVFVAIICLGIFYTLTRFGLLKPFLTNGTEDKQNQINVISHENSADRVGNTGTEDGISLDDKDLKEKKSNESTNDNNEKDNEYEENDDTEDTVKRKRKRGARGGKKNKKKDSLEVGVSKMVTSSATIDSSSANVDCDNDKGLVKTNETAPKITKISNNLSITEEVLGFGSHGTIVFKGFFENRPVAVKRMLIDFYDVASHEINLLQESDDHSNVIRYFCSQEHNKFLYIALELCSASLEDVIEKKREDLKLHIEKSKILFQIANGVNHLHSLKIVHRDIKPQNILVVSSKRQKKTGSDDGNSVRFLISDFGLCKRLDADQSSFRGTTANAAGTSGWRAPELLLDTSPAYSTNTNKYIDSRVRLTRSVDIFSAGCVFYYVLTNGFHPFGDRYIREGNIIKAEYDLSKLNSLPDAYTIKDLIGSMIQKNPNLRPDITAVMKHPFFWSPEKKLEFLLKVSDRFEIERRDPPSALLLKLESIAPDVLGSKGWFDKFDDKFIDNLGKYRKYNTHKLMDLLRAIRNKYHHYQDLPKDLAAEMGPLPDGFYWYFARKFPRMLLLVYRLMKTIMHDEELLVQFF